MTLHYHKRSKRAWHFFLSDETLSFLKQATDALSVLLCSSISVENLQAINYPRHISFSFKGI
jgi:hypothetical protein